MTLGMMAFSCAKPDAEPYEHTECKLRSAYIKSLVPGSADMIYADIDEDSNPPIVSFRIPKTKWSLYDTERMKVVVNVTYDVVVEPSLSGVLLDLSDYDNPYQLTVRNTVTGESRVYGMYAYNSVDLK